MARPAPDLPDTADSSTSTADLDPAWAVLDYPTGTTVTFVLLVGLVLLVGVFVGDWLYLSTAGAIPGVLPPLQWLAAPPMFVSGAMALLTLAAPRLLERRRRLVDVPPGVGDAALRQVRDLASYAGLRRCPRVTWNPTATHALALAYGRPGRYRLALSPALLGAARRRPDAFNAVIRHELAHLRNHDVVLAYAAMLSWYAVVPVLAAPLAWRIVDRDWSLVPEYLVRAAVLALLVYLVRAVLLRSREHDADLRAAWWSERPDALANLLATGAATGGSRERPAIPHWVMERRWWALHPAAGKRADVVRCPALHSRPSVAEFFGVGLLAGACLPLLLDLVIGIGDVTSLQADRIARAIVFGLVGGYVTITLTRAAGTGGLAHHTPLRLAVAIVGGAATGVLLSLGSTGLLPHAETNVVTVTLTAVLAGSAVIVLVSESARLPGMSRPGTLRVRAVVLVGAVLAGLASNAALAVSTLMGQRALDVFREELPFVLTHGGAAPMLGALVVVVAVVAFAGTHAVRELRAPVLWGAAVGLLVTAWMVGVRLRVGSLADDEVAWRYYLSCVWLAVGGSIGMAVVTTARCQYRILAGVVAGAVVAVVSAAGFVAAADGFGGSFGLTDVASELRLIGGVAIVIGLPVVALASVVTPVRVGLPGKSGRSGVAVSSVLVTGGTVLVLVLVPAGIRAVDTTNDRVPPLAVYLDTELPQLAHTYNQALAAAQQAETSPRTPEKLLNTALPVYDRAIRDAQQVTGPEAVLSLNAELVAMMQAERAAIAAEAASIETPDTARAAAFIRAAERARAARMRWQHEYQAAIVAGAAGHPSPQIAP